MFVYVVFTLPKAFATRYERGSPHVAVPALRRLPEGFKMMGIHAFMAVFGYGILAALGLLMMIPIYGYDQASAKWFGFLPVFGVLIGLHIYTGFLIGMVDWVENTDSFQEMVSRRFLALETIALRDARSASE